MNKPLHRTEEHDSGNAPEPGHDAWVRQRIEAGLEAKRAGKLTYKTLPEIAAQFGIDAP